MSALERMKDLGGRALRAAQDTLHDLGERVHPEAKKTPPAPPAPTKAADEQHDRNLRAFAQASQIPPPPSMCEAAKDNRHDAMERLDPRSLTLFVGASAASKQPIDYTDVVQGKLDDCYLLASMAAVASTPKGQALLRSMIKETAAGYEVTLPGLAKAVTVSKTEFGKDRAGFGTSSATKKEIWPMVIESACAKVRGGYTAIGNCGTLAEGMGFFTRQHESHAPVDGAALGKMERAIAAEQPVVVVTKPRMEMAPVPVVEDDASGKGELPVEHMMAVLRVDLKEQKVELYDTVQNVVLFVPLADLQRCAGEAIVGTL
jgi:hypothetical protein